LTEGENLNLPAPSRWGEQPRAETDVSEREQPGGKHPPLQPWPDPPDQPTGEVVVGESGAQPTYANVFRVMATPEGVILDFGLNPRPFTAGRQVVRADHTIIMSPYATQQFWAAIGMTIDGHELSHAAIKLDVSRRVSPPQPFAPAEALGPAGQAQVVRLLRRDEGPSTSGGPARSTPRRTTMTTTLQHDRDEALRLDLRNKLNELIGEQVMHSLGTPADLLKVQVRGVGSRRYRVNVFVGKEFISGRIADSFFLTADGQGNILMSSPEIVRVY
jgi:hypothetical protein